MRRRERLMGHLRSPTSDDLITCARQEFIELTSLEAEALVPVVASYLQMLDEVEAMPEPRIEQRHRIRDTGFVPTAQEDPYAVFSRICRIEGSNSGPLAGRTIAVKDNINVAGVPQTNGSRVQSFVPTADAAVIERVLDAGATITGMLNMDDHGCSGYGETSIFGPPRNPRKPSHTAGGSSGGAGSALAAGLVDLALGGDAGGSARIPAAMCGVVAMKATYGLIPRFGTAGFPTFIDSICPMARTVNDVATLLEVIAGPDWRDPTSVVVTDRDVPYGRASDAGVKGMRIGVIRECLEDGRCDASVLAGLSRSRAVLARAGAIVEDVSIPAWNDSYPIWFGLWLQGLTARFRSDDLGFPHVGLVDVAGVHLAGLVHHQEAGLLPPLAKASIITTAYIERHYFNTVFARVHNQRFRLCEALKRALEGYDALMTPTSPTTAVPLATERVDEVASLTKATSQVVFTSVPNVTGLPALALPSGEDVDGLPTSVQLIGRAFDEHNLLRAGYALEGV